MKDNSQPTAFPTLEVKDNNGNLHKEEWRRFRSTDYYVSTLGRVFSTKTNVTLSPHFNHLGYHRVRLSKAGSFFVHRLVSEVFIDNPDSLPIVNHKDGDPNNNAVWNCEWTTHKENTMHAVQNGLMKSGADHSSAVLTEEQVTQIRKRYAEGGLTFQGLARELGVTRTTVARAVTGATLYYSDQPPVLTSYAAVNEAKRQGALARWAKTQEQRAKIKEDRKARVRAGPLNASQVMDIREAIASGKGIQEVADLYSLKYNTVMAIFDRRAYDWVTSRESVAPKPGPKNMVAKAQAGLVNRNIITPEIVEATIKMRLDGYKLYQIAKHLGFHEGTIKRIVQNKLLMQRDGRAMKMPVIEQQKVRVSGKITPEMIFEFYQRHLWSKEPMYLIGKDLDIPAPSQYAIIEGRHYLQREGTVPMPSDWLADNPPPSDVVLYQRKR